jgi:hypothetical protein
MHLGALVSNRHFCAGVFVLLGFLCFLTAGWADVPDMMINTDGTSQLHNEEQIWVSPIDSNVVMIVWRDFRLGYRRVGLGVSYDEGHTWTDSLLSGGAFYRYSDPCISGDRLGNFYPLTMNYTGYGFSDYSVWKTTDNGTSWSGPYYLIGSYVDYLEDKEFLAIDRTGGTYDGNMYVAWARFPGPTRIMFVRSTTGGVSWDDTLIVGDPQDFGGSDAGQFAFPFVDADGAVYVIWRHWYYLDGWRPCQVMVKSTDGGQSFSDPVTIFIGNTVDYAPGGIDIYNSVCMEVDLTNGPYHGNIYFTVPDGVQDGPYYHSDILFMKSSDGGTTWTDTTRVNDDPLGQQVYQFHQWITVNQKGAIIILFYDQRNHPPLYEKFDAYIAFSFDGGETFTTNYRVSDVSSDPNDALGGKQIPARHQEVNAPSMSFLVPEEPKAGLIAEYIGVAAYNDQIHCTWTDTRDGNQNVYYSNFGIPLLPPRLVLPGDGEYQLTLFPIFKWAACGYFDQTTYDLEISTDITFTSVDFTYSGVDTNVFAVSMPLEEVEYFWRVRAIGDADTSEYSEVWSFNVDVSAPDIPTLLSPADGETVAVYTPMFAWSQESKGSPVFYTLQVADDSLFPGGPEFYEYAGIYDTSFVIPDALTDSTTYYWRVRAADEIGHESNWQEHAFRFYLRHFVCGDANGDGEVTPGDVVYLINYLFRGGAAPDPLEAGDVNSDGAVEPSDVVYLINYLFRGGPPPCEP